MKKVDISYNPYKVISNISIDGKKPIKGSSINDMERRRLQEWIEALPSVLLKEYRDTNFEISFTGTQMDYDDVVSSFEAAKDIVVVTKYNFINKAEPTEAESLIDSIFTDIQNGPIQELKDQRIIEAFEKAKNSRFEINVIATMSSGKSTLINALLGKRLMPAANEATTATIVKIVDTEKNGDEFDAKAYDKSNNLVESIENITLQQMTELNKNETVSTIELYGKIPFVKSVGMKLVLVDTPGPNNSRDVTHKEMTYRMLQNSDKTLVLYVMNGTQLGINDEKMFLDDVSRVMREGGKQSRERFIFAVNKMDSFKPKEEGEDCILRALENAKNGLEEREIFQPNIFPVTSLSALEKRSEDDEPMAIDNFKRGIKKYSCLHFDNYYQFSHQDISIKKQILSALNGADELTAVELHSGIVNIEMAINQYVNKYAKTLKVADLVLSFDEKLKELAAVAHLEDEIRKNKSKKAELERQIEIIKSNIKAAKEAKTLSGRIDKLDPTKDAIADIQSYMSAISNRINKLRIEGRLEKEEAIKRCKSIEKECQELMVQVKVKIEQIIQQSYKRTISSILDEYKKYLSELNIGIKGQGLEINPIDFVAPRLNNINSIMNESTFSRDEGQFKKESYKVEKDGWGWELLRTIDVLDWFKDDTHETKYRDKWVSNIVEYVDMNKVDEEYLQPIEISIQKMRVKAVEYVQRETLKIKDTLKKDINRLDDVLDEKLDNLENIESDTKATEKQIKKKEEDLKWLQTIQKRVDAIIEF